MSTEVKRKICMIGDFAVGKTSLVRQFVSSIFSDRYLTTVGVKIDTKTVMVEENVDLKLVLWDIAGEPTITSLSKSYMNGMSGYVLVADGTRISTFYNALHLHEQAQQAFGELPFVFLINKADLVEQWVVEPKDIEPLLKSDYQIFRSSAKTGESVEEAFMLLAKRIHEEK